MTFNLRSMRLILALDWLVDLHRFLTTPPMLPTSSSSASASPPPTDTLRGGGSIRIGGECNKYFRLYLTHFFLLNELVVFGVKTTTTHV